MVALHQQPQAVCAANPSIQYSGIGPIGQSLPSVIYHTPESIASAIANSKEVEVPGINMVKDDPILGHRLRTECGVGLDVIAQRIHRQCAPGKHIGVQKVYYMAPVGHAVTS